MERTEKIYCKGHHQPLGPEADFAIGFDGPWELDG